MASWIQQAMLDAPVERIWALLTNPNSYVEWGDAVEVTGVPTRIEQGSTFEQRSPDPFGREITTTFKVEELEDLREIKLRCQSSGYYSRWRLTEAQGGTFTEVELGVAPIGLQGRIAQVAISKRQLRKLSEANLDGLRRVLAQREAGPGPE